MTAIRSWRAWSCTVGLVIDGEHRVDQAAEDLVAILARVDRIASRVLADSVLSMANERVGRPVGIPRDLVDLVGAAMDASERTVSTARRGY